MARHSSTAGSRSGMAETLSVRSVRRAINQRSAAAAADPETRPACRLMFWIIGEGSGQLAWMMLEASSGPRTQCRTRC